MAQNRSPATDEIRRAIDKGETRDKVNFPDPAAAFRRDSDRTESSERPERRAGQRPIGQAPP